LAVRARDHRGLDGDRQPQAIDAAPPWGRSTAEDGGGGTLLPREEWVPPGFPALAGWQAQGKKVSPPPLRQGDRGLPSCGPITPSRGRAGCARDSRARRRRGRHRSVQEAGLHGRRNRSPGVRKGGPSHPGPGRHSHLQTPGSAGCGYRVPVRLTRLRRPSCSRSDLTIRVRRSPSRRYDEAGPPLSLAAGAAGNSGLAPAARPHIGGGGSTAPGAPMPLRPLQPRQSA